MADPVGIANCQFWYKADDATTIHHTANALDTWDDKSGNARNLTQTGGSRPTVNTRTLNSKNVVDFDGTNDGMPSTSFAQAQPFTVYAVVASDDGADSTNQAFFDSIGGATNTRLAKEGANTWSMYGGTVIAGGTVTTTAVRLCAVFNGASSELYLNNTLIASGNAGAGAIATGIYLGLDTSATIWWDGTIAETVGYAGAHNSTDRGLLENYNAFEWFGVPYPSTTIRPTLIVGASQAAQRASRY